MQNEFLPHESDFQLWLEGGFQPSKPETTDFLCFLADPDDEREPRPGGLWPHQWAALLRLVYTRERLGRTFWSSGLLTNIVTGGGKTALIAAVMVWLRLAHQVQRFLILCPNLIVRDRLEDDFRAGQVFRERQLIPPSAVFTADDFALTTLGGDSKRTASDLFGANVVLANIHQFYESNQSGASNLAAFLGINQTPFAVFNDEAHNTPAPEYDRTLRTLAEHGAMQFRLDTTATPDRANERPIDSRMIYEYDIPAALNDGVIATPVVYQPSIDVVELTYTDALTGETRGVEAIDWDEVDRKGLSSTQWVTDAKPMSQQISIACKRLQEARRNAAERYRPILFVVAVCKADAKSAQAMLEGQFNLRALLVTEDSEETARKDAAAIAIQNRYDAVVSVAMLREGWDVPEVAVVLPLRKIGSKVYGPQIIGRGLRRVRRKDIPAHESQICAVVDHPKLEHDWLWKLLQAAIRTNVGVEQEFDEQGELPPQQPNQQIVNPDMIIAIPEPVEEADAFEPVQTEPSPQPSREWRTLLNQFEYDQQLVEITDQQINAVVATELSAGGWTKHLSGQGNDADPSTIEFDSADLRDSLEQRLRAIAQQTCETHGWSLHDQRYIHSAALAHLAERFCDGLAISQANQPQLRRAFHALNQLERFLMSRPDIVGGMIEYAND